MDDCYHSVLIINANGFSLYVSKFRCTCTKERLFRAVVLMGRDELQDILLKREDLKAKCEFCGTRYPVKPEELVEYLEKGIEEAKKGASLQ